MNSPGAPRPSRVEPRPLAEVADALGVPVPPGSGDVGLSGATHDSRAVRPGDLYAALPGARAHGADFCAEASAAGAVAVLTDAHGRVRAEEAGLPALVVPRPRAVLGDAAATVYGHPADRLLLLGVTGTNGKTTTSYLLESGLRAAGHRTGLVGGVETRVGESVLPSIRTTPEATDLHALFALMLERRVTAVAMEVSSHALVMGRVGGAVFDVAAFTNLSQDHLDFHGDMEHYFAAKASLFEPERARRGVVNVDDPAGQRLAATAGVPVETLSPSGGEAVWRAVDVVDGPGGARFRALGPEGLAIPLRLELPGGFNVANALVAAAVLHAAGTPAEQVVRGLSDVRVPGRMERVDGGGDVTVVVDFGHTPAAVSTALAALRPGTAGRVVAVLGAGGDRDPAKRPLMGEAAARGADVVVVTDDNPRSEDPAEIRGAVLTGARRARAAEVREVGDRREAISAALGLARPGDTVAVLGRGHERVQEVAGVMLPLDDRQVVRDVLQAAHGERTGEAARR